MWPWSGHTYLFPYWSHAWFRTSRLCYVWFSDTKIPLRANFDFPLKTFEQVVNTCQLLEHIIKQYRRYAINDGKRTTYETHIMWPWSGHTYLFPYWSHAWFRTSRLCFVWFSDTKIPLRANFDFPLKTFDVGFLNLNFTTTESVASCLLLTLLSLNLFDSVRYFELHLICHNFKDCWR